MEFPLQLRHCLNQQHDTAALLIPGDDADVWISAVLHVEVSSDQLRFLLIHENRGEASVTVGAVCVFPPGVQLPAALPVDFQKFGCQHYGQLAERLFLPVEASLFPEVSNDELETLLPDDTSRLFVWHPAAGLIGFDPEHILTIADLLSSPPISEQQWLNSAPDEQINRRIRSLVPEPTLDVGDILNSGQDDIGSEPENLTTAPRAPDEKSAEALRDSFSAMKKGIARAIFGLTSKLPTSDRGNRALGRLHDWAQSIISSTGDYGDGRGTNRVPRRPDAGISTRRENEIKRLLNLLQNDPDKGLKYALPMGGGDNDGRGIADATDRLGARDINFDPSRMYSSGPADAWDIPWQYQIKLMHEYRQLAQREQQLGRYRRAAYIYARLLNDLPASAAALEAGRYYHDAATIYLEQLQDPAKAAGCLRAGGFWEEAAQIYRNRELWVDAGELYEELGQVDNSRQMFGNAIQNYEVKRNYVGAAEIADKRLDDPEQASELLVTGWMQAADGRTCLAGLLTMLGRRGMHDRACQMLRQVTDTDYLALDQVEDALAVCSQNADHYPDENVRNDSRKHCWRLAATMLNRSDEFDQKEHQSALAALRSLAPTDRLLQTDSQRYHMQQQTQREATQKASPSEVSARIGRTAQLVGRYPLIPEGTEAGTVWSQICCNGSFLYRIGCNYDIFVVRQMFGCRRDGRITTQDEVCRLPRPAAVSYKDFHLRLDSESLDQAWLFTPTTSVSQSHPTLHQTISESGFLNIPYQGDGQLLDVDGTAGGWQHSLSLNLGVEGPVVDFRVVNYLNLAEQAISVGIPSPRDMRDSPSATRMLSHSGRFYSVIKNTVVAITAESGLFSSLKSRPDYSANILTTLPFAPLGTVVSPSATEARLAFSFESGAHAIWPDTDQGCSFATDLTSPMLAFSLNGILAAACRQTHVIEFWRLNSGEAIPHATYQSNDAITHLTCGAALNQILAFHSDGSVSQLSIPTR